MDLGVVYIVSLDRPGRLDVEVLEDRVQLGVRVLGLGLEDLDLAQLLFRALDLARVRMSHQQNS